VYEVPNEDNSLYFEIVNLLDSFEKVYQFVDSLTFSPFYKCGVNSSEWSKNFIKIGGSK